MKAETVNKKFLVRESNLLSLLKNIIKFHTTSINAKGKVRGISGTDDNTEEQQVTSN
jgi:hypothetical protein